MRKLLAYFIAIVGPAAVITAGTMGAGATSVREGFVSVDRARKVYGVNVDPTGKINIEKTNELRCNSSM